MSYKLYVNGWSLSLDPENTLQIQMAMLSPPAWSRWQVCPNTSLSVCNRDSFTLKNGALHSAQIGYELFVLNEDANNSLRPPSFV